MPGSILGNRVRRVEDPDLLTGKSTYVSNLRIDGCLSAAFTRSPFVHAHVRSIDTSAAAKAPGVVGVFTGADLALPVLGGFMVLNAACERHPLAEDKVRFAGEPVAVVVAETQAQADDAAELVEVDYDPLPAAAELEYAASEGAPLQFESLGTNVVAGYRGAHSDGSDPLAGAATVVRAQLENQRVSVVPMECDAIAVVPGDDGQGHDLTVYVSTQMPHAFADGAAKYFEIERPRIRVVAPHVGGAFGGKIGIAPEHAVVVAVARRLGRPVRWVETRAEAFLAAPDGRSQLQWIEAGFDADGHITGMHWRVLGEAGAYAGFGGALALGPTRMMAEGVYRVPKISYDVASVVTNTSPMGAFRGAGRPEAAELLERIMDISAAELGIEPVDLRRRNLRPPFSEAVTTVVGTTYDTGDYEATLDRALEVAGDDALRVEQARRRAEGGPLQLGIGVAVYVEVTAGGGSEFGVVEVAQDGTATIRVGTSSHGQGHATAFSMIVSDALGIPMESIRFIQSDTAAVERGGGTGGSRSLQLGGSAVRGATLDVLEQGRQIAAAELEASAEDIVVHEGGLGVTGVPARVLSWAEIATIAARNGNGNGNGAAIVGAAPGDNGARGGLAAEFDFKQSAATFPFGAHVSVVEVDMETGKVRPVRHVAVDDCGRILNPLLVTGQQHGGIGQGIAQALYEEMRYDESGNPLTASLADYEMPSAAELPSFEASNTETPTFLNPLGAKGIGESGTIGSTPSVHNAVVDALSHLGVRHVAMPCTPERVWQAIEAARAGRPEAAGGGRPLWREPPAVFATLPPYKAPNQPEAAAAEV